MSEPTDANRESVARVIERIATIRDAVGLGDAVERYAVLIAREIDAQGVHVRSPTRTAAACVLAGCRLRETPVRVTVLAEHTTTTKAQVLAEMQRIADHLDVTVPLEDPTTILEETCRDLELPDDVYRRARRPSVSEGSGLVVRSRGCQR